MQKIDCGVVARARVGWRRYLYLGQGPARQLLLGSVAAVAAACQSSDAPLSASTREAAPDVVLGTARAAVISNTTLTVVGDTPINAAASLNVAPRATANNAGYTTDRGMGTGPVFFPMRHLHQRAVAITP